MKDPNNKNPMEKTHNTNNKKSRILRIWITHRRNRMAID